MIQALFCDTLCRLDSRAELCWDNIKGNYLKTVLQTVWAPRTVPPFSFLYPGRSCPCPGRSCSCGRTPASSTAAQDLVSGGVGPSHKSSSWQLIGVWQESGRAGRIRQKMSRCTFLADSPAAFCHLSCLWLSWFIFYWISPVFWINPNPTYSTWIMCGWNVPCVSSVSDCGSESLVVEQSPH